MSGDELSSSESEENVAKSEEESEDGEEEEEVPEYEKKRLKMIEENKRRMEAMGLHKMASSFMGSVGKVHKKKKDNERRKGKKKMVDEDEEYNPNEDDEGMSSSSDENVKNKDFPAYGTKKVKSKSSVPMKRGPVKKKLKFESDYVDDDDSLMQAIALSLGFADVKSGSTQSPSSNVKHKASPKTPGSCNIDKSSEDVKEDHIHEESGKRKKKKMFTSRVQMSEDEMLVHFLQFDETDKGYITLRDVQRLATEHDFTWTEEELADMIRCFDGDGDQKVTFDDFRKIVVRCKMLKSLDDSTAG